MGNFVARIDRLEDKIDDVSPKIRWNLFIIVSCLSWIVGFILVYSFQKFKSLAKLDIIKKRYPFIVKTECIFCMCFSFILIPLLLIDGLQFSELKKYSKIIRLIHSVIFPFVSHAIANMEGCRCWLMYFKINYLFECENKEWKHIINDQNDDTIFWIKYKNTFGNFQWIWKRFFVYYLIAASVQCAMINLYGTNFLTQLQDAVGFGFPCIMVVGTWMKAPKVKDHFLFYYEFKATASVYLSGLLMYSFNVTLWYFDMYLAVISTSIIGSYTLPSVSILSTLIIPKKIVHMGIWLNILNNPKFEPSLSSKMGKHEDKDAHHAGKVKSLNFSKVFQNHTILELFVRHLLKEFCSENLLAYIELKQFRDIFLLKSKLIDDDARKQSFLYKLPVNIPQSRIVFHERFNSNGTYTEHELKHLSKLVFIDFYKKYISNDSKYIVNIGYGARDEYETIYKHITNINDDGWNLTLNEILTLYDPILKDMIKILRSSQYRFIRSPECTEYLQSIKV